MGIISSIVKGMESAGEAVADAIDKASENFQNYHINNEKAKIYKSRAQEALDFRDSFNTSHGKDGIAHVLCEIYASINMLNVTDIWEGAAADACRKRLQDIADKVEACGRESYSFFNDTYRELMKKSDECTRKANNARSKYTASDWTFEGSYLGKNMIKEIRNNVERMV